MIEIVGYVCAVVVGLSLGVLGAGGSILTIPILIYLFHIEPLHATTYSFFIVGFTALIGTIQNIRKGTVQISPALYFAATGSITIYLVRNYLLNLLPETLFILKNITITKDIFILCFFSLVMAVAGLSMILQKNKPEPENTLHDIHIPTLILLGIIVGIVIAFAGVGGGFLITPALSLFAGLNMKKAIGTSLCIVCINSFVGFFSSLNLHEEMNWQFLISFVACTAVGILAGTVISKGIESTKLKKSFGWFVLLMSFYILTKELILER